MSMINYIVQFFYFMSRFGAYSRQFYADTIGFIYGPIGKWQTATGSIDTHTLKKKISYLSATVSRFGIYPSLFAL